MSYNRLYDAFKEINNIIRFNTPRKLDTNINLKNTTLDDIKNIDMTAQKKIINSLKYCENIIGYISEETNDLIIIKDINKSNNYIIAFDPIDGSSNILSNITVGTIYSIYEYNHKENILENIIEAGYCLYGPTTILVKTNNNKVVEQFILDKDNNFIKDCNLKFSDSDKKLYAINQSNIFSPEIKDLILYYKRNDYNQRWIGSMVADCHQILTRGGVFLYPITDKYSNGKLRLLYEVIPFSHIFKIAGGIGIDCNYNPILDRYLFYALSKKTLHKPIPIILCSNNEYQKLLSFMETRTAIVC